jgi:hypothetical protein
MCCVLNVARNLVFWELLFISIKIVFEYVYSYFIYENVQEKLIVVFIF